MSFRIDGIRRMIGGHYVGVSDNVARYTTRSVPEGFFGTKDQHDAMMNWVMAEQGVANAEKRFREAQDDLDEVGVRWHPDKGFGIGDWWYSP